MWDALPEKYHSISEEVRAITDLDGIANFTVGGLYEDSRRHNQTFNFLTYAAPDPATGRYFSVAADYRNKASTTILFGQIRLTPVESIELAAGVRWTHTAKDATMINTFINANTPFVANRRAVRNALQSHYKEDNWSPEVTLIWHPTRLTTIYAAYKQGWKPGGITTPQAGIPTAFNSTNTVFGSETVRGGEIHHRWPRAPIRAAMDELGNTDKQEIGRHANNRAENSHLPFRRRERAILRFRHMKSLQKFASVHASLHNRLFSGTPPR